MGSSSRGASVIVNADDYGYFDCVSRGILASASQGIVTATGVFANAPHFDEHVAWLRECDGLDVGIHLTLTTGEPLTSDMRKGLSRWSGRFPGKFPMAMAIISGAISVEGIAGEWRAQIERCRSSGLRVRFLNSHEHMHMLPALFRVTSALARDHAISHVRYSTSSLAWKMSGDALSRGAIMKALATINRREAKVPAARFLGMETSGRLDLPYLERTDPYLRAGEVYELMCHPGHYDAQEVSDPRLVGYHDWEGELRTLTSTAARTLLDRHGVTVIGYRHLEVTSGRLVARQEASHRIS